MSPATEKQIDELVRVFYARARAHAELGPLFEATIVDWDRHLQIVQDFWSHALKRTGRYRGHAYPAHVGLPIRREHFGLWLELFRGAALDTLPAEAADAAIASAEHMSESFRAGLFPFDPPTHGGGALRSPHAGPTRKSP